MSFFGTLDRLQQSSVQKRKAVLVVLVTFIMIIVIAVWVMQLKLQGEKQTNSQRSSTASPFQVIWESVKDNLKEGRRILHGSN